jgi:hypothetical protein
MERLWDGLKDGGWVSAKAGDHLAMMNSGCCHRYFPLNANF